MGFMDGYSGTALKIPGRCLGNKCPDTRSCRWLLTVLWISGVLKSELAMQTILVIDEDENLRDTLGLLLEREGFRAVLAANGKRGLDHAILGRPALILTDLRLPDLSGIDVCKRIRISG